MKDEKSTTIGPVVTIPSTEPSLDALLGDTWLAKELATEVAETEPDVPPQQGDTEIGIMSPLERTLYNHTCKLEVFAKMTKAQAEYKRDADLLEAANLLIQQANVTSQLMWSIMQDRLPNREGGVGIRQGFKIVSTNVTSPSSVQDLLGKLFS